MVFVVLAEAVCPIETIMMGIEQRLRLKLTLAPKLKSLNKEPFSAMWDVTI